jgi:hypothetical protein
VLDGARVAAILRYARRQLFGVFENVFEFEMEFEIRQDRFIVRHR